MLSSSARTPTGNTADAAIAPAQSAEAMQQARIARPVLLVRPRNTISTITRMKASAHPR